MKRLAGVVAAIIVMGIALPARATFHIMVIQQLFAGFADAPAQYVVLELQAPLQTAVYGQPVLANDAAGEPLDPFGVFCSVPRQQCILPGVSPACSAGDCPQPFNAEGSRILVATRWAQDLFCVTADLPASGRLPFPDGRVCFGDCDTHPDCPSGPVDCLAYGAFTGDNGIFGGPAPSPMLGEALTGSPDRRNQFNGGQMLDNSIGFTIDIPAPRNFHGDEGRLDGLPGDPRGTGVLDAAGVEAEVRTLFEADHRCELAAARRGADANLDTQVNAADLVRTIQIVSPQG